MGIVQLALPRQNDEEKKANEREIWKKKHDIKELKNKKNGRNQNRRKSI